jgi:hypothetical protein
MSRATTARPTSGSTPAERSGSGYFQKSELPLTSLIFLLPLLVFYEVGKRSFSTDVTAFAWMQDFFHLFGAYGRHLPALAVVGILLAWHIARRDSWKVDPKHVLGMFLESVMLAVPLYLMARVAAGYLPMMSVAQHLAGRVVLSVGAGIYEELVFRLIAFTLLSLLLVDLLGLRRNWANLLMVVISSVGFSLYHYLGHEAFQWQTFAFRTAAGFYFGAVFAFRGYGISAGSHAAYDVIVNAVRCLA